MSPKKKKISDNLMDSLISDLKDVAEPTTVLPDSDVIQTPVSTDDFAGLDDKTVNFAEIKKSRDLSSQSAPEKVSYGAAKPLNKPGAISQMTGVDAQIQQVENLRLAQNRILDLERHLEKFRQESEQLHGASEAARVRAEELQQKVQNLERTKEEAKEQAAIELNIYRDNLANKDYELSKAKMKVEELESRLALDLKKIRVRERELENRLELLKAEKQAVLRAKDETILDLKRKIDQLTSEMDTYKMRCVELNQKIDSNNDQFARTVRALRLALTNLEASENTSSMSITPLKKAE